MIDVETTLLCPHCGYDLRGLPEPRCPECGQPFSVDSPYLKPGVPLPFQFHLHWAIFALGLGVSGPVLALLALASWVLPTSTGGPSLTSVLASFAMLTTVLGLPGAAIMSGWVVYWTYETKRRDGVPAYRRNSYFATLTISLITLLSTLAVFVVLVELIP